MVEAWFALQKGVKTLDCVVAAFGPKTTTAVAVACLRNVFSYFKSFGMFARYLLVCVCALQRRGKYGECGYVW